MKKIGFSILLIMLTVTTGNAQQVYFETGVSSAWFKGFETTDGETTLDNRYSRPKEVGFGTGVLIDYFEDRLQVDAGISFNRYKINTSAVTGNSSIPLFYDFSTFTLKTGFYLKAYEIANFKLRAHSHISHSWLTFGTLAFENEFIDLLREDEEFDSSFFNFHYGAGFSYTATEAISFYFSYDLRTNLAESSSRDENYKIRVNTIAIGIMVQIDRNLSR